MNDEKIIMLFEKRDQHGIEEVKSKYARYCRKIAMNITGCEEDSEEVLNDALLGLWNSIPPKKPECLATYIGRIVRNLSLKKVRDENAGKRGAGVYTATIDEIEISMGNSQLIEDEMIAEELKDSINIFLKELRMDDRTYFVRRYWYFDSIKDIARRFKVKESKVKMSLSRSREKLKKFLAKEGYINE